MGFFTLLLQRSLLRRLLGGTRGASQVGRSGGLLGKAAMAMMTAMLVKRVLRRR